MPICRHRVGRFCCLVTAVPSVIPALAQVSFRLHSKCHSSVTGSLASVRNFSTQVSLNFCEASQLSPTRKWRQTCKTGGGTCGNGRLPICILRLLAQNLDLSRLTSTFYPILPCGQHGCQQKGHLYLCCRKSARCTLQACLISLTSCNCLQRALMPL